MGDPNPAGLPFHPAPLAKSFGDSPSDNRSPALVRLLRLHQEAFQNFSQARLLDRAPSACLAVMFSGAVLLFWMAQEGGANLPAGFVWSLWLLTGVIALTVIYIRGFARHPAQGTLETATRELRKFLLYTGTAWGLGAYAVMPGQPDAALIFAFVALPGLAMILVLKDDKAMLAFCGPVMLLSLGAAAMRGWPHGLAATLGAGVICIFMLQRAIRAQRDPLAHLTQQ
ncbi:MAG TPA: hypothetical protein VFI23_18910 [Rhizomicrobium sp.]|nr:hypothetical protein [Rhizomicrobium sp.]